VNSSRARHLRYALGWGPGKVVSVGPQDAVCVVWRDVAERQAKRMRTSVVPLRVAENQRDAVLENLPPVERDKDGKLLLPKERVPFAVAMKRFTELFPLGFAGPKYTDPEEFSERKFMLDSHQYTVDRLGGGRFRPLLNEDQEELTREVIRCAGPNGAPVGRNVEGVFTGGLRIGFAGAAGFIAAAARCHAFGVATPTHLFFGIRCGEEVAIQAVRFQKGQDDLLCLGPR